MRALMRCSRLAFLWRRVAVGLVVRIQVHIYSTFHDDLVVDRNLASFWTLHVKVLSISTFVPFSINISLSSIHDNLLTPPPLSNTSDSNLTYYIP